MAAAAAAAAGTVRGQRGLAAALGVSPKTANKYVRDGRWRLGNGPWDAGQVAEAQAWRRQHFPTDAELSAPAAAAAATQGTAAVADDDGGPADPVGRAKLELLLGRIQKLEIDNARALRGLVDRATVDAERVQRVAAVREALFNVRLLALQMEGKGLAEREDLLERWARGVCRTFEQAAGDAQQ